MSRENDKTMLVNPSQSLGIGPQAYLFCLVYNGSRNGWVMAAFRNSSAPWTQELLSLREPWGDIQVLLIARNSSRVFLVLILWLSGSPYMSYTLALLVQHGIHFVIYGRFNFHVLRLLAMHRQMPQPPLPLSTHLPRPPPRMSLSTHHRHPPRMSRSTHHLSSPPRMSPSTYLPSSQHFHWNLTQLADQVAPQYH